MPQTLPQPSHLGLSLEPCLQSGLILLAAVATSLRPRFPRRHTASITARFTASSDHRPPLRLCLCISAFASQPLHSLRHSPSLSLGLSLDLGLSSCPPCFNRATSLPPTAGPPSMLLCRISNRYYYVLLSHNLTRHCMSSRELNRHTSVVQNNLRPCLDTCPHQHKTRLLLLFCN